MSAIYKRQNAELSANLTPMIDVTFLLIVFFILVSQIVEVESVEMNLPEPSDPFTEKLGEEQRAVINVVPVRGSGRIEGYRIGTHLFAPSPEGLETMTEYLRSLYETNPNLAINLRSDQNTDYQYVEPAMQAVSIAAARVESVSVTAVINLVVIVKEE